MPCPFCSAETVGLRSRHRCPHGAICFHGEWGRPPELCVDPGLYGTCLQCTMTWRALNGYPQYLETLRPKRPRTDMPKRRKPGRSSQVKARQHVRPVPTKIVKPIATNYSLF